MAPEAGDGGSMKLYSLKTHGSVERQVHFGIGNSVKTACGLTLFSRHVMVSVWGNSDGALITDDFNRVTCKRCLASKDTRLRRLLAIEASCPGIFDREALCGQEWLMTHALDVNSKTIEEEKIEIRSGELRLTLTNTMKPKDRKEILRHLGGRRRSIELPTNRPDVVNVERPQE